MENNKMKLEKSNKFKSFKVKPLILAAIIAGGLAIGGITVGVLSSGGNNPHTVDYPTTNSSVISDNPTTDPTKIDEVNGITITSVNTSKLNLSDFDKLITPSFDRETGNNTFSIKGVEVDNENYKVELSDGSTLVSSFDNSVLIDTNYKPIENAPELNDISAMFDRALINHYDKVNDVTINGISLNKIDGEDVFVVDTSDGRNLSTSENIIPYHALPTSEALDKYDVDREYLGIYIESNGQLIRIDKVMGLKDVKINGSDFTIVVGVGEDKICREYLTTRDKLIYSYKANAIENTDGTHLGYSNSTSNYAMQYKDKPWFYKRVKDVVLQKDNTYHVLVEDAIYGDTLYVVPARLYSFEFRDKMNLIPENSETLDVSKYTFLAYDQDSFDLSIMSEKKELVKVGDTYFYVVDQPLNPNPKTNTKDTTVLPSPTAGVYNAESSVLMRVITEEEFKNNYNATSGPLDFSFNITGNTFSDDSTDGKYVAFNEVNMLGLECYTIVREFHNPSTNETNYLEVVAPKTYVLLKGEQQDIAKSIR